jgi:hypothetical protein
MEYINQPTEDSLSKKLDLLKITQVVVSELENLEHVYEEIEDGYRYLANNQYTEAQVKYFEARKRPVRAYNIIFSQFNLVLGDFIVNRTPVTIKPYRDATRDDAERMNDIKTFIEQDNDLHHALVKFGLDAMVKHGFMYIRYTNEKCPQGSIVITEEDAFDIGWDTSAKHPLLDDADYWFRSLWYGKNEILEMISDPQKKAEVKQALENREDMIGADDEILGRYRNTLDSPYIQDERQGKYRIVEYHYFVKRNSDAVYDMETDEYEWLMLDDESKREAYLKAKPSRRLIRNRRKKIKRTKLYIPALNVELWDREDTVQDEQHDLIHCSAFMVYARFMNDSFGHFRLMKDSQDAFNEFSNISEDLLRKISNPTKMVKPDNVVNYETYKEQGDIAGAELEITKDAQFDDTFKPLYPTDFPFAPEEFRMGIMELLPRLTGITQNMMGSADTQQENASLYAQRVQQGRIALMVFYDAYRRSLQRLWEKAIRFVQCNLTDERLITIEQKNVDGGDKSFVINQRVGNQVINDVTRGRFKVFVDDGSNDKTSRALRYMQKLQLTEMLVNLFGAQAIDPEWLLGESDLGDIDKIIERINMLQGVDQANMAEQKAMEYMNAIQDSAGKQLQMENQMDPAMQQRLQSAQQIRQQAYAPDTEAVGQARK